MEIVSFPQLEYWTLSAAQFDGLDLNNANNKHFFLIH